MELKILDYIQTFRTPLLDKIMVGFSSLSNHGEIWIFFGMLIFLISFLSNKDDNKYRHVNSVIGRKREFPKREKMINKGFSILLALLLSFIVVNLCLKPLVMRVRPYEVNQSIKLAVDALKDYSFPSGHASASFAAAVAMCFWNKRFGALAIVLASIISFSRLYLYVHYPSDVIAGIVIGIICGLLGHLINKYLINRN